LQNGGFIQFGYQLSSPGYYCLFGQTIGFQTVCYGSGDMIGHDDARWFWQYWPNPYEINFYSAIGPANSGGLDGSWHLYQIVPNEANGWTFLLDGKSVSTLNSFQWVPSKDPIFVVAEEVTSFGLASGRLGPVEFKDLSYSKQGEWHQVESLQAISTCVGENSVCDVPYGLRVLGSDHIIAGTGEPLTTNGELLWTAPSLLELSVPHEVQTNVDNTTYTSANLKLALVPGLHTITVPDICEINVTNRLRFQNWSDGSTNPDLIVNMSSDLSLRASYVEQLELTIVSPFPVSGGGWYDQGSIARFTVNTSPRFENNSIILLKFDGWYDANGSLITPSGSGAILMNSSHVIEARWHQDYTVPVTIITLLGVAVLFICIRKTAIPA